mmetsp:Transcript_33422/g.88374  ORF Transcript_33422/g.88374 Transcript_33422/m.88374 type:complete len:236 (-) Transcript_33422:18-725(-)
MGVYSLATTLVNNYPLYFKSGTKVRCFIYRTSIQPKWMVASKFSDVSSNKGCLASVSNPDLPTHDLVKSDLWGRSKKYPAWKYHDPAGSGLYIPGISIPMFNGTLWREDAGMTCKAGHGEVPRTIKLEGHTGPGATLMGVYEFERFLKTSTGFGIIYVKVLPNGQKVHLVRTDVLTWRTTQVRSPLSPSGQDWFYWIVSNGPAELPWDLTWSYRDEKGSTTDDPKMRAIEVFKTS